MLWRDPSSYVALDPEHCDDEVALLSTQPVVSVKSHRHPGNRQRGRRGHLPQAAVGTTCVGLLTLKQASGIVLWPTRSRFGPPILTTRGASRHGPQWDGCGVLLVAHDTKSALATPYVAARILALGVVAGNAAW